MKNNISKIEKGDYLFKLRENLDKDLMMSKLKSIKE